MAWSCTAITGAGDLTADIGGNPTPLPPRDPVTPPAETPSPGGGEIAPIFPADGTPGDAPPLPATRIRDITFEDGALVHPKTGLDSTFGSPTLLSTGSSASSAPLAGSHSMSTGDGTSGGMISFPAVDDVFITFRARFSGNSFNYLAGTIARVRHGGSSPIDLRLGEAGHSGPRPVMLTQGGRTLSQAGSIVAGTTYRFAFALHRGSNGNGKIEIGVGPDGNTPPTSTVSDEVAIGAIDKLEVGSLGSGASVRAIFDEIHVDRASFQ